MIFHDVWWYLPPQKKIFGTHLALCPGPKGAQNPLATGPRLVFLRRQHVQLGLYWLGLHVLSEQQLPRFGSNMFNHCQAIFPDFPDFGKLLIAYHIYSYCIYIYTHLIYQISANKPLFQSRSQNPQRFRQRLWILQDQELMTTVALKIASKRVNS